MHALYDAQRKAPTIVNEQRLGITLIPEASLWLYRSTKANDTSYFYVCKRGEKLSEECLEHIRDIQPFVIIPDTNPLQAIWRIYLLGKAHTQLPANWHGNYVRTTLILEASDMESIQPIDRRNDRRLIMSGRTVSKKCQILRIYRSVVSFCGVSEWTNPVVCSVMCWLVFFS